jgi:LCP family protein required for cell wall assembly
LNVLLIGKDYNHNKKGTLYTTGARSDTLILLSLDLTKRQVSALSIPRDTYVEYPHGLPGRRDKVNAAYAWGGAKLAMKTVGDLLGVVPDHYIALKPDAVKTIVDQLGGVEVETIDKMKYDDRWAGLHIDLPAGKQTLNGDQAVGFTRFRKVKEVDMLPNGRWVRLRNVEHSKEEGDDRRMARQQQLLRAMLQKAKQPQMFMRADELINNSLDAIETDLNRPQLFALAVLFKEVKPEQMRTGTLSGRDVKRYGKWYFQPDARKKEALVAYLLKGDEAAANRLTVVEVKNGTAVRGAASQAAAILAREGFDAKNAGNAAPPKPGAGGRGEVNRTQILYGAAVVAPRAQRIAFLLGGGTLTKTPKEQMGEADVTVVLGRDLAPTFAASNRQREARLR